MTAHAAFADHFGVDLEMLVTLYRHPAWNHTNTGSVRWAEVSAALVELRDTMERGDGVAVQDLLARLPNMRHNTGSVREELDRLDRSVAASE
jgi:hypothetical protein